MLNINFVPDDYVQKRQSYRANIFYLVLFVIMLCVFGGTFLVIKARQRKLLAEAKLANVRLTKASETISQLEELQGKRKQMMKTALVTAELIEPVPRSLVLAAVTNSLPAGVSLTRLKLVEKKLVNSASGPAYSSKYEAAKSAGGQQQMPGEKILQTQIEIEGLAPSDIYVAQYIARLSNSILFEDVNLVHSKEHKIDEEKSRMFELATVLKRDIRLTKEDIASIKAK